MKSQKFRRAGVGSGGKEEGKALLWDLYRAVRTFYYTGRKQVEKESGIIREVSG